MQRHPVNSANSLAHLAPFTLGSVEWASLPDLDVPAILAKIDTGAQTSALHADAIEVYRSPNGSRVRFDVHPMAGRSDVTRRCDVPLIARRWVTSSNGGRERRCVISTTVEIGHRRWPIEVTLTNRGRMRYRMLLGQRAILDDMAVVPSRESRQPVIGYRVYDEAPPRNLLKPVTRLRREVPQNLRIGLIGEGPVGPAWQMLADTASARSHAVERIDARSCRLLQDDGQFRIESAGRVIGPLDAALALGTPCVGSFVPCVVRHAELAGATALNGAEALAAIGDPARLAQILWSARLPTTIKVLTAVTGQPETPDSGVPHGNLIRGLLIDGKIIASDRLTNVDSVKGRAGPHLVCGRLRAQERRLMVQVAGALRLGVVRIDLLRLDRNSMVIGVDTSPSLLASARLTTTDLALAIIKAIERRMGRQTAATREA